MPKIVDIGQLTPREEETMTLLCEGLSYDEVATKFGVTKSAVAGYIQKAKYKLMADSNADAIRLYKKKIKR